MQQTEKRLNEEPGPQRIERLERMEGMTTKVFAGVIVLVIAGAIISALVT